MTITTTSSADVPAIRTRAGSVGARTRSSERPPSLKKGADAYTSPRSGINCHSAEKRKGISCAEQQMVPKQKTLQEIHNAGHGEHKFQELMCNEVEQRRRTNPTPQTDHYLKHAFGTLFNEEAMKLSESSSLHVNSSAFFLFHIFRLRRQNSKFMFPFFSKNAS